MSDRCVIVIEYICGPPSIWSLFPCDEPHLHIQNNIQQLKAKEKKNKSKSDHNYEFEEANINKIIINTIDTRLNIYVTRATPLFSIQYAFAMVLLCVCLVQHIHYIHVVLIPNQIALSTSH